VTEQPFDVEEYRRERLHRLERENDLLKGERVRLERLLALALRVAVGSTGVSPTTLLSVLGVYAGTNLGRAAFIEQRERREAELALDKVVYVVRETPA